MQSWSMSSGARLDTSRRSYAQRINSHGVEGVNLDADAEKRLAAEAAAELVEDGMAVGLGTGSTVEHLLPALAARDLTGIRCVATSVATEKQARELGIPVEEFGELERLDIAIDGTDQVTPDGWLIKGGGGAHLREKIVAAAAERFVVIADSSKPVEELTGPVPLELFAFGLRSTLARLGESVELRDWPPSPDDGVIADYRGRDRRPGGARRPPRGRPRCRRPRPLPPGDGQRSDRGPWLQRRTHSLATLRFRGTGPATASGTKKRFKSAMRWVVLAHEVGDRRRGPLDVLRSCLGDRLDIGPIPGAIEERLEDDQRGAVEDWNVAALEPNPDHRCGDSIVERKVVQEDVNRGAIPVQPGLSIALDLGDVLLPDPYRSRHGSEDRLRLGSVDEDVDIEVARPARLLNAVGEGDGSAECMGDTRPGE